MGATALRSRYAIIAIGAAAMLASPTVVSAETVQRYASLSRDQVFLREGPSYSHRILWIYKRKGLPVGILAEYDTWRRVRDIQGAVGWMHSSMLSDVRTVEVSGKSKAPVHETSNPTSAIVAIAEPRVIAKLRSCLATVCKIETAGLKGWVEKSRIWGVKPGETF
jgi:SH3-like domain-containing protein